MKVNELIEILKKFDGDLEVSITDGYGYKFYRGQFEVSLFEQDSEKLVDIGVGGCEELG